MSRVREEDLTIRFAKFSGPPHFTLPLICQSMSVDISGSAYIIYMFISSPFISRFGLSFFDFVTDFVPVFQDAK